MRKWFRVATEGQTTDGRKITREWIEQMAATYDRAKYGARIWMEHWRGLFADGAFPALGDVLAVKSEPAEDGKLALFAELHPTAELMRINQQRQKVYTSIEVDPDFAGSGQAYLVGLGVTDSPASLGTEMLQFSAQRGADSPLAPRKQRADNVFSAAVPLELDFSDAEPDPGPSLLEQVKALFARTRTSGAADLAAFRTDLAATLEEMVGQITSIEAQIDPAGFAEAGNRVAELDAELQALRQRVDAMHTIVERLSSTPDHPPRAPATGGTDRQLGAF